MIRCLKTRYARKFLVVDWRGVTYLLPHERLILDLAGPAGSSVCLWSPRNDEVAVRKQWVADTYVRGLGCFEARGKTPQHALDALDRVLTADTVGSKWDAFDER
jgi:hypothetical protein